MLLQLQRTEMLARVLILLQVFLLLVLLLIPLLLRSLRLLVARHVSPYVTQATQCLGPRSAHWVR